MNVDESIDSLIQLWRESCNNSSLLSIQRIVQLLSVGAFELRKIINNNNKIVNGNLEKENKQQIYLNKWIKNEKMLIEFGVVDIKRLTKWINNFYNLHFKQLLIQDYYFICNFADKLEEFCLLLNTHSLPCECKPRAPFLPLTRITQGEKIVYQTKAEVTARVDIAGGWTDTPPITYQMQSVLPAVLSLSIFVNGKRPLRCRCSRLEMHQGIFYQENSFEKQQKILHFSKAEEIFTNCCIPSQSGSLLCSILVVAGFVREKLWGGERHRFFDFVGPGRGLFIQTESDLPHGSGLGSSSILSGALLSALYKLAGYKQLTEDKLIKHILRIEQLHTSGGGWQDQLGGCIVGGAKIGWIEPFGQRKCVWRSVQLGGNLNKQFTKRLVLLYTGKTRLAKTLLKQVLLSWARQDTQILNTVERLANGAWKAEKMLIEGKFPSEICSEYNELKKAFASNTEPLLVKKLKILLEKEKIISSAWMAGAGGGGFLYIWLNEENDSFERLKKLLKNKECWKEMNLWNVELENDKPLLIE